MPDQNRLSGVNWNKTSTKPKRQAPTAPKAPGWGEAHGRTEPPSTGGPQYEQPQLTPFEPAGPQFANRGIGKYHNGQQFNKPAVKSAMQTGLDSYARSRYFRQAGFGAALRYTLGLPQVPSHVNDYLNSGRNRRVTGINPSPIEASENW